MEDARARFRRIAKLARMAKPEQEQSKNKELTARQRWMLIRIGAVLVVTAILTVSAYAVRLQAMVKNLDSVAELNEASRCVALAAEMRTLSRELRIGDGWVAVYSGQQEGESIARVGLPPTAETDAQQVARLRAITQVRQV